MTGVDDYEDIDLENCELRSEIPRQLVIPVCLVEAHYLSNLAFRAWIIMLYYCHDDKSNFSNVAKVLNIPESDITSVVNELLAHGWVVLEDDGDWSLEYGHE